ncbi:hypothetical protein LLG10_07415 [bacterium]|nr:hypothetical protein [bacterium]
MFFDKKIWDRLWLPRSLIMLVFLIFIIAGYRIATIFGDGYYDVDVFFFLLFFLSVLGYLFLLTFKAPILSGCLVIVYACLLFLMFGFLYREEEIDLFLGLHVTIKEPTIILLIAGILLIVFSKTHKKLKKPNRNMEPYFGYDECFF